MSRLFDTTNGAQTTTLRSCTFCAQEFPAASLVWLSGCLACTDCRAIEERRSEEARAARDLEHPDLPTRSIEEVIDRVDRTVHYGGLIIRWSTYLVTVILATKIAIVSHLLHGFIMADFATWLATAWADVKTQRRRVISEGLGFLALTLVMTHTDWLSAPDDPESIGISFLSFTLFFTVKGSIALVNRLHGDR